MLLDVCVNDCVVFDRDLTDAKACPLCASARRDEHGKAMKQFRYIPLIPQLLRLFGSAHTAASMTWAALHKFNPLEMRDITESPGFAELVRDTLFRVDERNLALMFCSDGVQPFSGSNYDMWPIFLSILNLPPHLRNLPQHMLLVGLIPGRNAPVYINTYLRLLVDELVQLELETGKGVVARDAANDHEEFQLYARLCVATYDYRAAAKVNCQKGSGATLGCMKCLIKGVDSLVGQKKVYIGHRQLLDLDHPFRSDDTLFATEEHDEAPKMRDPTELRIDAKAAERARVVYRAKPGSVADPSNITAVTGESQFMRLKLWHPVDCSVVDLMHLVVRWAACAVDLTRLTHTQENFGTRWVDLLSGKRSLFAEDELKKRPEKARVDLVMSEDSRKVVKRRLDSLQLPSDFGSNCAGVFEYTGNHSTMRDVSWRACLLHRLHESP